MNPNKFINLKISSFVRHISCTECRLLFIWNEGDKFSIHLFHSSKYSKRFFLLFHLGEMSRKVALEMLREGLVEELNIKKLSLDDIEHLKKIK